MQNLKLLPLGLIAIVTLLSSVTLAEQDADKRLAKDFFKNRVAPVLKAHCLECHNPDRARGGLDLSSRTTLLEGGGKGPAIVPGDAKKSLLLDMVHGPKPRMPQKRDPLSAAQVNDLMEWIDAGAPWPDHVALLDKGKGKEDWWAVKPLERPKPPPVKDKAWPINPIDHFILAALEAKGMKPSAPADRAAFIRRVTYDLTGVPPTPEEVDAFVNDKSAEAFEKLVDRLLASPRYGERWARHWLDIIHYADTHGFDKDKRRFWAWLLRDWVIRAFNQDMPYRRFLHYQVAGDVLFPTDPDGIIATGFIAAGPWDFVGHVELREGTVEKEKTRTLDRDDMVANTFSTFTSLTVHCARCHNHKFDPISQKEYYQLQAIFAGLERGDRPVESKEALAARATSEVKLKTLRLAEEKLISSIAKSPELNRRDEEIATLRTTLAGVDKSATLPASPTNGYHSAVSPKADVTKWVQVDLGAPMMLDGIRLVPARPTDFKDSPGFGFPARFKISSSEDESFKKEAVLLDALADDYPNPGTIPVAISLDCQRARYVRVTATRLWNRLDDYVFALAELQAFSGGKNVALNAKVTALDTIDAGRWHTKNLVDHFDSRRRLPEVTGAEAAKRLHQEARLTTLITQRRDFLEKAFSAADRKELARLKEEQAALGKQLAGLKEKSFVYSVLPREPRPIHVLSRGDVERKGDLVPPAGLGLIKGLDHHFAPFAAAKPPPEEGARRAALARWLSDGGNTLVWRSIVNRIWHYHFGKGIVDTPNDFGRMGGKPSHPELLDWLAAEFREHDSFKRLHRMIVLSQTYRQASTHRPEYAKLDADNRLLWRMNRQRLDAESIRDSVLAVSGKLDLKMYGPGFDLFRFKDDHSPVYDHLDLKRINAPDTWRRTVFRFVVRSVPNPFLENLDCADPNLSVPVRSATMTALQALAMLNNPFMVEQAEFFAKRVEKMSPELAGQVEAAFKTALGRRPDLEERDRMTEFARRHGLANACRVILNLNEFLFID